MAQQQGLVGLGRQRTFDRGAILIHEGARDRTVYILLRGCVKVVSASASGHSVLLAVRLAGDLVGELAALDDEQRSATVVTAARTSVRSISHEEFARHLAAEPDTAQAVQRSVVGKLRQATRLRSDVTSAGTRIRLSRVLAQLGRRYGRPTHQGVLLDVQLTQAELAALIGVGEASVQRALSDLRSRGLVRTGYRQLLLRDLAGLDTLADPL